MNVFLYSNVSGSESQMKPHFSLHFNGHYPGGPGLAGPRMSPLRILLEWRVMEVMVTTAAIRRAKLQSYCHHQQTNTQFLQAVCPSCFTTNSTKALKESNNLTYSTFYCTTDIDSTYLLRQHGWLACVCHSWYCIKTNKPTLKRFWPSGCPII